MWAFNLYQNRWPWMTLNGVMGVILRYLHHKYVHHRLKLPSVFCEYFDENKQIHHHDTRQKENFYIYVLKSEIGKRAIKYKGGKLCNNLPTNIKKIKSLNPFITVFGKTWVTVSTFLLLCYLVSVSIIRNLHFVYVHVHMKVFAYVYRA